MSSSKKDKQNRRGQRAMNDVMSYQSSGNEKYLNMNQSAHFELKKDYDYLLDGGIKSFATTVFRGIIWFLLELIDRIYFGIKINGKQNMRALKKSGAVLVCNHVHPMDCTFTVLPTYPKRQYFLTLESNFRIPVIRHLIRWLLAVPIGENPFRMKDMFSAMQQGLKKGYYVLVYPEGELEPYCKTLREFKDGSFRLAVNASVPVLPMAITYRRPKGIRRLWQKRPLMTLNILPPINPVESGSVKERAKILENECRIQMESVIND